MKSLRWHVLSLTSCLKVDKLTNTVGPAVHDPKFWRLKLEGATKSTKMSISPRENSPKSAYELQREKNIKELQDLLNLSDSEGEDYFNISDAVSAVNDYASNKSKPSNSVTKPKSRSNINDDNFNYVGRRSPVERRRSSRLAKLDPEFSYMELPEEMQGSIRTYYYENDSDEENKSRCSYKKPKRMVNINGPLRTKEITEKDFANIAQRTSEKVYSVNGTTCHQCRQKTVDTKSFCHNPDCTGVQGQFCGPCLRNRYGEDLAETLKNPTWICPYCRNECNCSFCRTRDGKIPTGIKAPKALNKGFKSVHHFLLYEEGDYNESKDVEVKNDCSTNSKESKLNSSVENKQNSPEKINDNNKVQKNTSDNTYSEKQIEIGTKRRNTLRTMSKMEEQDLLGFTKNYEFVFQV